VTVEEYRRADEIFLTGTTIEIVSVVSLDGAKVGTGSPGPVAQRLYRRFGDVIDADCPRAVIPLKSRNAGRRRRR
jgi:D-alanine transaminase